jgi:PhoPQ-activated pathogenicity-related protein
MSLRVPMLTSMIRAMKISKGRITQVKTGESVKNAVSIG